MSRRPGERNNGRVQVKIDMAMEKPWTSVVGEESDGDIVTSISYAHDIADDSSFEVVGRAPSAPHYGEAVPMQVDWVLSMIYDISKETAMVPQSQTLEYLQVLLLRRQEW
jgi:hypothetical protein